MNPITAPNGTVLVINAGSSSIKYQLVDPVGGEAIASGIVERIGQDVGIVTHKYAGSEARLDQPVADHSVGLRLVLDLFAKHGPDLDAAHIVAVGHRVVQGGAVFSGPVVVTDEVVEQIRALVPLAPLHNPGHVAGLEVARELLPDVPHVVVFDTAFFQTLPKAAYTYAIPPAVAEANQIRRYGFHGTSHEFVSKAAAEFVGRPLEDLRQIVLHLGNGASVSAVRGGRAVDTSMGLTPLEGLVMGTRSGDIDPAVIFHLHREGKMSIDEIDTLLNKQSGMLGLTGESDFRAIHDLVAEGDASAVLGLEVYAHRLKKYVGAYLAVLGGADVITFTAGIGENDDVVRWQALAGLEELGIELDADLNAGRIKQPKVISTPSSRVTVLVVPTNEELAIARQAVELAG
ncbi:acetate kinase [Sanguibacter hominis ATCC BAA-789]|uniref:Acetate kinase n=1 Tax=Sanguibacter hominis ATCC BAA-789 TaxID=1312740 RepID=A0A9X5FE23_9MICO|nr:acetate kinase [Sanguibacter hominis]NKX92146.1 acetate kinase [Sanguibacter hominis ATCC BAA-789]